MAVKQRFLIEEKVYDVVTPATIKHFNFYYNVAETGSGSGVYTGKSMQMGAPVCYWLGSLDSEMPGQEFIWEGDGFPTVVCKLFEWYFWDVDRLGYRFASNQNGWKIYTNPQIQTLFVKMILVGSRGPEVMIVPEKSSAWRRIKRGDYEVGGVDYVDSIAPMIDTDLYVSISHGGTIKTVLLPIDAPFNPKDYSSYGTDEGWPLYSVNGRQWKVSWVNGVAVFTELTKWPEEEDTYITIYQWRLPMSVKTSGGAPFDITKYPAVGITADGWNIYEVNGRTWKVWALSEHVQYTEMILPSVEDLLPGYVDPGKVNEKTDDEKTDVEKTDVEKKIDDEKKTDINLPGYVPFVILVGLLGIFSIAAQRK